MNIERYRELHPPKETKVYLDEIRGPYIFELSDVMSRLSQAQTNNPSKKYGPTLT